MSAGTLRPVADVLIRLAGVHDAEAIRTIYNLEVTTATSTFDLVPRSLADQGRGWRLDPAPSQRSSPPTTTARCVGFASLSPYKERAAYRTTVEDSVYVDRRRGGEGIGTALLTRLLDVARASGFHAVIARIESSGDASLALHARCGFELVGIERQVGRKFNRWLDVAVMQCLL